MASNSAPTYYIPKVKQSRIHSTSRMLIYCYGANRVRIVVPLFYTFPTNFCWLPSYLLRFSLESALRRRPGPSMGVCVYFVHIPLASTTLRLFYFYEIFCRNTFVSGNFHIRFFPAFSIQRFSMLCIPHNGVFHHDNAHTVCNSFPLSTVVREQVCFVIWNCR